MSAMKLPPLALAAFLLSAAPAAADRLAATNETSWMPWGAEALARARRDNRPVLLVVGDNLCAACLVREKSLLGEPALAPPGVVPVRVDRLDRPDLDDLFSSLPASSGEGGDRYPFVVLLLPDGRPFAATRPLQADELRAFLLGDIGLYLGERPQAEARAARLTEEIRSAQRSAPATRPLGPETIDAALRGLAQADDPSRGIDLLVAEASRPGRAEVGRVLDKALARLARASEPLSLPARARRLEGLAIGAKVTGDLAHADRARVLAEGLLGLATDDGAFRAAADDETVVTAWNGLAVSALVASSVAFDRPEDMRAARRAAAALARPGGPIVLVHLTRGLTSGGPAYLEDYAFLARGLLDLHDATGDPGWLKGAEGLANQALTRFLDSAQGGFFMTEGAHEPLPVRPKSPFEDDVPSGNGVLAAVLLRLSKATGQTRYAQVAEGTLTAFAGDLQRAPRGVESLLVALGETSLGSRPAVRQAAPAYPAKASTGPVGFEAVARPAVVAPGRAFDVVLTMSVGAGFRVPAHDPGLEGLSGLAVSVPAAGIAVEGVRYPEAHSFRDRWAAGAFRAFEGRSDVMLGLRVPRGTPAGAMHVRVRVRFQACGAQGCEAPDSVVLDVPVRVAGP